MLPFDAVRRFSPIGVRGPAAVAAATDQASCTAANGLWNGTTCTSPTNAVDCAAAGNGVWDPITSACLPAGTNLPPNGTSGCPAGYTSSNGICVPSAIASGQQSSAVTTGQQNCALAGGSWSSPLNLCTFPTSAAAALYCTNTYPGASFNTAANPNACTSGAAVYSINALGCQAGGGIYSPTANGCTTAAGNVISFGSPAAGIPTPTSTYVAVGVGLLALVGIGAAVMHESKKKGGRRHEGEES